MKLLLALTVLSLIWASSNASAQLALFDTKSVVSIDFQKATPDKGSLLILLKDGWHINANPASLSSLIPTEIRLVSDNMNASISFDYPKPHALATPLGDINVYSNTITIPIDLIHTVSPQDKLSVTAQACDAGTCYPPATWEFLINTKN